jgi:hypothetical protein
MSAYEIDGLEVDLDPDTEDVTVASDRWPQRWTRAALRDTAAHQRLTREVLTGDDPPTAAQRRMDYLAKVGGYALEAWWELTHGEGVVIDRWIGATPTELPAFLRRQAE